LVILSAAMMMSVAAGSVGTVLLMSGRSGAAARNTVLALAVTVGIDLVAVPLWGATGAALGWTAGVVLENGLGLLIVSRRLRIRPDVAPLASTLVTVLAVSVVSVLSVRALLGTGTTAFLVSSAVTLGAVLVYVYLARGALQLAVLLGRGGERVPSGGGRVDVG
jgi:O-antigen/teichoic acid export membrane protein